LFQQLFLPHDLLGDLYWKLTERAYEVGYPRKISQDWDGLPDTIDAAVTDYDGDTYFLKVTKPQHYFQVLNIK